MNRYGNMVDDLEIEYLMNMIDELESKNKELENQLIDTFSSLTSVNNVLEVAVERIMKLETIVEELSKKIESIW